MSAAENRRPAVPDGPVVLPGGRPARDPARSLSTRVPAQRRDHVVAIQRDRLIDSLVQVVAEQGYESATIKAICRRAGVAYGTFYEHFGSKEELFLAAFDAGVDLILQRSSEAYLSHRDEPWRDRVWAGIEAFLQMLADSPRFATFFIVETHKVGDAGMARIDAAFELAYGMFTDIQARGELAIPVETLGPLVLGGIYNRIYQYVRAGRAAELPALAPALTEFAVAVFAGSSAADRSRAAERSG